MGRPKKDPKDTYKGKREARKMAKMEVRKERERKKLEKKQLNEHGKGLTPDGRLEFNSHVGWKFEKQITHELKPEPEFEFEFEPKPEIKPKFEPAVEPKSELYPMSQPVTSPVKAKEESFVVKIKSCTWPDLEFSCLEQDTQLQCQDGSVTAPSLVLALLAPWLGQLLQPGRGQEDSISIIICPGVKAASLRIFLEEVATRKEEIVVDEDVRGLFMMNLSYGLKEISTTLSEVKINDFTNIKDTSDNSLELKTITDKRKTMQLVSRTKPKANIPSEVVTVKPKDDNKIRDFEVIPDEYEKCHKCNKHFINLDSQIHICKGQFKKVKRCTVCHKTSHKSNYHSTTPATCENCGKLFRNRFTLTKHSLGCIDEKPCPICGKLVKQMKQHTDFRHTSDLDKKWRCEHCGKGFLVQRRMEIHTNSHLKLKPYKCRKGCDLGFSDPAHRGRHEKRLHKIS